MIRIYCSRCGLELEKPGAVLLAPPKPFSDNVEKSHVCERCWLAVDEFVRRGPEKSPGAA
jgi:hypothetical protein